MGAKLTQTRQLGEMHQTRVGPTVAIDEDGFDCLDLTEPCHLCIAEVLGQSDPDALQTGQRLHCLPALFVELEFLERYARAAVLVLVDVRTHDLEHGECRWVSGWSRVRFGYQNDREEQEHPHTGPDQPSAGAVSMMSKEHEQTPGKFRQVSA